MRSQAMTDVNVVLIDDDAAHLALLERALSGGRRNAAEIRCHVQTFSDPAEAVTSLPPEGPVAILCDYRMPGGTGLDWLPDLLRADIGPVILMTGEGNEELAAQAFRAGAANYLVKSEVLEHPEQLVHAVQESLRRHEVETRNRELSRRLKAANVELEQNNNRLYELTQLAQEFVDDVAHEFRTPLAVIKEFSSIIREGLAGEVSPKQREYLDLVESSTRDLTQLVEDFLDSGKLRSGSLRVDRRPWRVADLFGRVGPTITTHASLRGAALEFVDNAGERAFFADIDKAARVLINLAINAIKFSPDDGRVRIAADLDDDCVRVRVRDNGPGLTQEDRDRLFERFSQVGAHSTGGKGFGLGLCIARDLATINFGEINVASQPGEGSEFSFSMPVDERSAILRRFCAVHARLGEGERVAVIRVTLADAAGLEDARAMIAAEAHPYDVALASDSGDSLVTLGACRNPERWIERLQEARAERLRRGDPACPPFDAALVRDWRLPEEESLLLDETMRLLEEFDVALAA